ncbi:hypothetical protein K492DRAFT_115438, partial [Lichtheimia hyalospora FSU 10163]
LIRYILLEVDAMSINRRVGSTCMDALDAIDNQLDVMSKATKAWTSASGYLGALNVQTQSNKLERALRRATKSCAFSSPVSADDTEIAMEKLDAMVPRIESTFDHIAAKKADIDSVPLTTPLVKNNIKSMHAETNALTKVLRNATPDSHKDQLDAYLQRIDDAYGRAYGAY